MLELIKELDRELFLFLNSIHSPLWDTIMRHISGKIEWIPLYLLLLILLYKVYGKEIWKIIIGAVLVITIADQVSVKLFKEVFERYRPCHNIELKDIVHIVNQKCGGKFGFVSSHAANSFAIATYIGLLLKKQYRFILLLLIIWAAVVSYSRIYLGVHYPLDVLCGAMLGISVGLILFLIVKRFINLKA